MVLIRQVEHLSGTKLTEASANVFKDPDWNWKVLIKIFCGCRLYLFLKLHDSSRASQVSSVCVCARTHECERSCGIKTNGNLQALTLCFCFFCFVFITCLLCHWIPSISGPLLIYIFIIYTSVFTRCLLIVGKTANARSYRNSISRIHAWGMSSISETKSLRCPPPHYLNRRHNSSWRTGAVTSAERSPTASCSSIQMPISSHLF